ncbi:hypothetical protein AWF53_06250, partial [Escherichia coli]
HGPDSYGRQQWGILHNGRKPDAAMPPAFNLSHDQTLQFKSLMLKELNFVMNYVFTLETWYSFFVLRR